MYTKNTKLYTTSYTRNRKKIDVYYRDLTILELNVLSNIKNDIIRYEFAANLTIINNTNDIPIGTKIKIGEDIISRSNNIMFDQQLLEISISEFRDNVKKDDFMVSAKFILSIIPGQSFTELLNLTYKDLIELVCLCEEISGKQIYKFGKTNTGKRTLINPKDLPDEGRSLQDQLDQLKMSH